MLRGNGAVQHLQRRRPPGEGFVVQLSPKRHRHLRHRANRTTLPLTNLSLSYVARHCERVENWYIFGAASNSLIAIFSAVGAGLIPEDSAPRILSSDNQPDFIKYFISFQEIYPYAGFI